MPRLFDRIGVDINQKLPLEPAVEWAVTHKVPYIDLCLDQTPELLQKDSPRMKRARAQLDKAGVRLGLHTLSAVNIAETSPFVTEAADEYLAAYIDAAGRLGAGWIVVHGGYHFGSDKKPRMDAAVVAVTLSGRREYRYAGPAARPAPSGMPPNRTNRPSRGLKIRAMR